eukprot:SAG31_NODE_433_length_15750_cov_6.132579_7_plen_270_part_00
MRLARLLCGLLASLAMGHVVSTQPIDCGDPPLPLSLSARNVMLVGDSISMVTPGASPGGYGRQARTLLTNKTFTNGVAINVFHNGGWGNGGQAASTIKGIVCTSAQTPGNWLSFNGTLDAIHFNFGLHDLVDPHSTEGAEAVNLTQYGKNLAQIYSVFAKRARRVIWATTTPCPAACGGKGRSWQSVENYNREAARAFAVVPAPSRSKLFVDDLFGAVESACNGTLRRPYVACQLQIKNNVHFTHAGSEFLGHHVATSILNALRTKDDV